MKPPLCCKIAAHVWGVIGSNVAFVNVGLVDFRRRRLGVVACLLPWLASVRTHGNYRSNNALLCAPWAPRACVALCGVASIVPCMPPCFRQSVLTRRMVAACCISVCLSTRVLTRRMVAACCISVPIYPCGCMPAVWCSARVHLVTCVPLVCACFFLCFFQRMRLHWRNNSSGGRCVRGLVSMSPTWQLRGMITKGVRCIRGLYVLA